MGKFKDGSGDFSEVKLKNIEKIWRKTHLILLKGKVEMMIVETLVFGKFFLMRGGKTDWYKMIREKDESINFLTWNLK